MISIVIPCFNESKNIEALVDALHVQMRLVGEETEIIVVDDGSRDGTLDILRRLKTEGRARYISFTRNFGHQTALKAGMERAAGEAVITLDGDFQHPPSLLPQLIGKWREGFPVVNTRRRKTRGQGLLKAVSSRLFYWVFSRLTGIPLESGSADFRLLDRKVVEELKRFHEHQLFIRGLVHSLGFEQATIDYDAEPRRRGLSKYTLERMLVFAVNGIMSFSIRPLRWAGALGLLVSFLSTIYIVYGIGIVLFTNRAITGWASLLISILFIGGIQMIFLGLLGEYIGKIFVEIKRRPPYIVKEDGL